MMRGSTMRARGLSLEQARALAYAMPEVKPGRVEPEDTNTSTPDTEWFGRPIPRKVHCYSNRAKGRPGPVTEYRYEDGVLVSAGEVRKRSESGNGGACQDVQAETIQAAAVPANTQTLARRTVVEEEPYERPRMRDVRAMRRAVLGY